MHAPGQRRNRCTHLVAEQEAVVVRGTGGDHHHEREGEHEHGEERLHRCGVLQLHLAAVEMGFFLLVSRWHARRSGKLTTFVRTLVPAVAAVPERTLQCYYHAATQEAEHKRCSDSPACATSPHRTTSAQPSECHAPHPRAMGKLPRETLLS